MKFSFARRSTLWDAAIDLGTKNIVVTTPTGICVSEPTVVATREHVSGRRQIVSVGREAADMIGRVPAGIDVVHPLSKGVISEFELTTNLLSTFLTRALPARSRWSKPNLLLSLPSDVTPVEERAFLEAGLRAGAGQVKLIPEPVAAALGSNVDIFKPNGEMLVDVGGGITEVALFSLGTVVFSHSARIGGNDMDHAITQYVRSRYNFEIGAVSAEQLKQQASITGPNAPQELLLKGINLVQRLPATLVIRAAEIREAMEPLLRHIVETVLIALEAAPDELSADLVDSGIWLTGGASLVSTLHERLCDATGLRVFTDVTPLLGVAQGELRLLRDPRLAASVHNIH